MPDIVLKNKSIEDKDVFWKRFFPPKGKEESISITYLTNDQIREILGEGTPYFCTSKNKLVITLKDSDSDTEEFIFTKLEETKDVKNVKADLFFKFTNNKKSKFERDDFLTRSNTGKGILKGGDVKCDITAKKITVDFEELKKSITKAFNDLKKKPPQYGILSLSFSISPKSKNIASLIEDLKKAKNELNKLNRIGIGQAPLQILAAAKKVKSIEKKIKDSSKSIEKYNVLVKCSLDTPHVAAKTTPNAPKVINKQGLQLANFISSPFVFDTFFVPQLSSSFVYNFYEPTEEDFFNYKDSKKFANKKQKEIPKFIELNWTGPPTEATNDFSSLRVTDEVSNPKSNGGYSKLAETVSFGGKRYSLSTNSDTTNSYKAASTKTAGSLSSRSTLSSIARQIKSKTGNSSVIPISDPRTEAGAKFNDSLNSSIFMIEQGESNRFEDQRDDLIKDGSQYEIEKFIANGNSLIKDRNSPDAVAGANESSRYVGYVIIKERLRDLQSENFEIVETIIIPKANKKSYIDTKIAYGEVYRYKIRSIYKFINKKKLPMFDDPDIILNDDVIEKNFVNTSLLNNAFYFDSQFSDEIEVAAVDERRPDPPFNFKVIPNSKSKSMFLTWNQKQQQKDVVGFNVYRRDVSGSFEKINQELLGTRNNSFTDKNVDYNKEYIYAVQSFDYHDNPSKLTFHIKSSLRLQDFQDVVYENGTKVDVQKNLEFGEEEEKEEKETIDFLKKVKISINPLYLNLDRNVNYLLKFTSLDSFIEKEIKLNFKSKIIIHRSSELDPEAITRADELKKEIQTKERQKFGYTEEEIRRLKPDTGFNDDNGR